MIVLRGGGVVAFCPHSSSVPKVCPGEGMVLDEIDSCIIIRHKSYGDNALSGGIWDRLFLTDQ